MLYLKYGFILTVLRWMMGCETLAAPRKMSTVSCMFKEKIYSPGDSWHPYLEPFGFMFCMRCACTESGHVKCSPIKCPSLRCDNPVTDSQQCCPRCADEQRSPAGLRAPVRTCRHNGTVYQGGETFTNHELFPSRQSNQCVLCTCSNGNIFCALKICQSVTCPLPVSVPETCCPVCREGPLDIHSFEDGGQQLNRGVRHSVDHCAGDQMRNRAGRVSPLSLKGATRTLNLQSLHFKGAAETTVKILLQRKHQRACMYSGKTYSHGDMWHPVLGKVLECILCTCKDGLQECRRITCPSQYPCKHPLKIEGKCCKICPESKTETNRTECYLGQDSTSLVVYKVEPSTAHLKDTVRTIAIEREGTTKVEVQVWKTVEGILQLMETGDVQKKDLIEHPENYVLLTTLDEETWKKFKEEEEDKEKDLSRNRACENGIKEVVKYLNPGQLDTFCTS